MSIQHSFPSISSTLSRLMLSRFIFETMKHHMQYFNHDMIVSNNAAPLVTQLNTEQYQLIIASDLRCYFSHNMKHNIHIGSNLDQTTPLSTHCDHLSQLRTVIPSNWWDSQFQPCVGDRTMIYYLKKIFLSQTIILPKLYIETQKLSDHKIFCKIFCGYQNFIS